MPLHRTNQLALEVSETAAPVLLFGGAVRAGTGVRVGFVLEDTVTSLCPQQPRGSPHAESVAVIPALNFTINCQRWLAGFFMVKSVLVLFDFRFSSCGRAVTVGFVCGRRRQGMLLNSSVIS